MSSDEVTSHFWIAGPPFFSSTILVASNSAGSPQGRVPVCCDLFDVDGARVNSFRVEFPEREVGVIEVEPFMAGLKTRAGITQGHLVVRSPKGTRHFCRQQIGSHFDLVPSPALLKSRESAFVPLVLGARREHLLALVNASDEAAQLVVRLMYGTRSPEWNVVVPASGCAVLALEDELLRSFDDSTWQKGAVQAYLRLSSRQQSAVACQIIERLPGETEEQEQFRCLTSW